MLERHLEMLQSMAEMAVEMADALRRAGQSTARIDAELRRTLAMKRRLAKQLEARERAAEAGAAAYLLALPAPPTLH